MGARRRDAAFGEFYLARAERVRASAYLLCGDWHLAADLTQNAFIKLYLHWESLRSEAPDGYLRRILVRTFIDERRRPWRREHVRDVLPEVATTEVPTDDRAPLLAALAQVAPRQRATLVLRFWEDLAVEETAAVLGCSTGTVKSNTARGLERLRAILGPVPVGSQE